MTAGRMSLLALAMALLSVACSGSAAAPDPGADVERPSTGQTAEADSQQTESSETKLSERTGRFITTGRMTNARKDHVTVQIADGSRVPGSGVRGRGSGERETTASSLAGKQQAREKEDNGGQGKDGPAGAIAQGGNGR